MNSYLCFELGIVKCHEDTDRQLPLQTHGWARMTWWAVRCLPLMIQLSQGGQASKKTHFVALIGLSGGFRDRGVRGRSHLRGPCLKVSEISFQFFLRRGAPSGLPKARGRGPWPPLPPLKLPLIGFQ